MEFFTERSNRRIVPTIKVSKMEMFLDRKKKNDLEAFIETLPEIISSREMKEQMKS